MKKIILLILFFIVILAIQFKGNSGRRVFNVENNLVQKSNIEMESETSHTQFVNSNKFDSNCTDNDLQALSKKLASSSNTVVIESFFKDLSKTYEPSLELDLFLMSSGYGLKRMRYLSKKSHKDLLLPQPYNGESELASQSLHLAFEKALNTNEPSEIINFVENQISGKNIHFYINENFAYPISLILNNYPLSNEKELERLISAKIPLEVSDLIKLMKRELPDETIQQWVENSNLDVSASFYWKEEKHSLVVEALKYGRYKLALSWYIKGAESSPEFFLRNALDVIAISDNIFDLNTYTLMEMLILKGDSPNDSISVRKLMQKISNPELKKHLNESVLTRKVYLKSYSVLANTLYQNLKNMVDIQQDELSNLCFQKAILKYHKDLRKSKKNNIQSVVNSGSRGDQFPDLGGVPLFLKQNNSENLKESKYEMNDPQPKLRDSFKEDTLVLLDIAFQNALNDNWPQTVIILESIKIENELFLKAINQFLDLAIATNAKLDIFDFLFRNGATLDSTALMGVVQNDNLELAEYLLNKGLELNNTTSHFTSPLKIAVDKKSTKMVKFLLENLPSLTQKTNYLDGLNFALINYGGEKKENDIIRLFLKHGYVLDNSHIDSLRVIKRKSDKNFSTLVRIFGEYGAL